jgi:outer membrane protein assembly factor BamB
VTKTNLAWEKDSGAPYVPSVVSHDGYLYSVNDNGLAICYETKTGKEAWRHDLKAKVSSSLVLIDGKVYVPTEKGDIYVFEATPTGYKALAKNSVGELVYSTPAVADGRLYIRGGKNLFCIGKPGSKAP